jgi:hypothetical protein
MKRRIIKVYLALILSFIINKAYSQNSGYIKLIYAASKVDKPYTSIVFYLPGSNDTSEYNFFNVQVWIDTTEFQQLKHCIATNKFETKSDILPDLFEFIIVENGSNICYPTRYKGAIRDVFNSIARVFEYSINRKRVLDNLEAIAARLGLQTVNPSHSLNRTHHPYLWLGK